jgi:hypothetical protein
LNTVPDASHLSDGADLPSEVAALRQVARETLATAEVKPEGKVATGTNTTGHVLRLPGGGGGYPAFWIRDAAMMLGGDLISADEIEGWIRVIAAVQPGPQGISLRNGLFVPGCSIPDHVNVNGRAVWFPGTYSDGDDQGSGQYGFLPPADDAFYFIQIVREHLSLTGKPDLLKTRLATGWGTPAVMEICDKAFESVAVDPGNGIVICDGAEGRARVDWGFCDSVRKTGLALFPTVLRHRAAVDLASMHDSLGEPGPAEGYRRIATRLRDSVAGAFLRETRGGEAMLISATGLGRKDDVWGSSFAVAEGVLPREAEAAVCRGLLSLYRDGGIVSDGQVRALPPGGPFGGFWEQSSSPPGHYQNGGYWGTMSGWLAVALQRVDPPTACEFLHALVAGIAAHRREGAPWEWTNPALRLYRNPLYCATVALPYATLRRVMSQVPISAEPCQPHR